MGKKSKGWEMKEVGRWSDLLGEIYDQGLSGVTNKWGWSF